MITITGEVEARKEGTPVERPSVSPPYFIREVAEHGVHITRKEKQVLRILMCFAGKVVPKDMIWDILYARREDGGPEPKVLDVYIARLRPKLRPEWSIVTRWGHGYQLMLQDCEIT